MTTDIVKKSNTHVVMVVDASGSMRPYTDDTIGGFNSVIDDLMADTEQEYRITAILFSGPEFYHVHAINAAPDDKVKLNRYSYRTMSNTALLDATGRTITEFQRRIKLDKNDKVVVYSITDGEENASKEYSFEIIRRMIDDLEATGQWQFNYLSQGVDGWKNAKRSGYKPSSYVGTQTVTGQTVSSTYSTVSRHTRSYSRGDNETVVDRAKEEFSPEDLRENKS